MKKIEEAFPTKGLRDIFRSYHYCQIYSKETTKNTGLIIEDGIFELCFVKERDITILSNNKSLTIPQSFGFGKIEMPYNFVIPSTMNYLAIKIQPWATSFFFNEDYSSILDLSETYLDIEILHKKIFSTNSLKEKVTHIENYFLNQPLYNTDKLKISKAICNYIYEKQGVMKIKDLMEELPYSRQKLNQLFFDQTKNSIKEFAIYTRLRAIMKYRVEHPKESLTNITYKFGYYDQSHFIKDMKRVTGVSPSDFSKSENLFFAQLKTS